jgi:hypothetical protein
MTEPAKGSGDEGGSGDDRRQTERRRYNRRTPKEQAGPPYYEAFDRIATALEGIRSALENRVVTLPGSSPARTAAPDPRHPPRG